MRAVCFLLSWGLPDRYSRRRKGNAPDYARADPTAWRLACADEEPKDSRTLLRKILSCCSSTGTMPAAMGLALASYVICHLAGKPIKVRALQSNITDGLIHKLYVRLENTERKDSGIEYVQCDPSAMAPARDDNNCRLFLR
jgi:hypothetical protein